ncbi:hypothetical protein ARMGADRAFT_1036580 [Armillaria gallica]|uniref:Uncharacterized protein n=1 Tax=Armillaria gallica TaxID=47427 RepID=A0A2H3CPQ4_ARMGA|nr:hypothetical protein ARMGADRAFT_1036580 [Armillaria gallica]
MGYDARDKTYNQLPPYLYEPGKKSGVTIFHSPVAFRSFFGEEAPLMKVKRLLQKQLIVAYGSNTVWKSEGNITHIFYKKDYNAYLLPIKKKKDNNLTSTFKIFDIYNKKVFTPLHLKGSGHTLANDAAVYDEEDIMKAMEEADAEKEETPIATATPIPSPPLNPALGHHRTLLLPMVEDIPTLSFIPLAGIPPETNKAPRGREAEAEDKKVPEAVTTDKDNIDILTVIHEDEEEEEEE